MTRSNRAIFAAAGWLILSAQATKPTAETHRHQAAAEIQRPSRPSVNAPSDPPGYHDPCKHNENDRASELCAQWTAAEAANNALYYAWFQLWAAAAGMVGLLVTIFLTFRAVRTAERSLTHAQEITQIELRAYMAPDLPSLKRRPSSDTVAGVAYRSRMDFKNYGSTPAVEFKLQWRILEKDKVPEFDELDDEPWDIAGNIAQGDSFYFEYDFEISKDSLPLYSTEELSTYFLCRVEYRDVFGNRHTEHLMLHTDGDMEWAGIPEHSGKDDRAVPAVAS